MAQYAHAPASPEWHPSLSNQHRSNILTHTKRKAEDELESQSHISSQFKKLRLNKNHINHVNNNTNTITPQTYTPQHHYPAPAVPSPPSPTYNLQHEQPTSPKTSFRPHIANTDARPAITAPHPRIDHHDFALSPSFPLPRPKASPGSTGPPATLSTIPSRNVNIDTDTDYMPIDDTPNRIIIHDLTSEIAQIEAEEASRAQSLFLPDIDKKVSGDIAQQLFRQGQKQERNAYPHSHLSQLSMGMNRPPENLSTALILYRDPSSISVPEEEDVVRRTIIEARKRAREKSAEEQRERERLGREAEMRALRPQYWDDAMVDHSIHDARNEDDGMDEDVDPDPMDIE